MSEQRKLATIMGIDVAGYSHAAETDERAAAEAVQRLRAALDEVISANGGRVFSTAGDGFMAEFPAAASAVASARALLVLVRARSLPRIRVGLHLGDVIVEPNGDLLGHGVNVAARLMQMAEPNTAVVSQPVQTQVRQSADVHFKPLGRVQLDKMSERVEVFGLSPSGARFGRIMWRRWRLVSLTLTAIAVIALVGLLAWPAFAPHPASRPSRLAVLRFETIGETPPYFAEGIADDLIAEVQRIDGMEVTARASSFALTGARATPSNAARELGATIVLTGSVQTSVDSIVVRAQLAEAPGGRQIWEEQFERPPEEIYALHRDIAARVARATQLRATTGATRRVNAEALRLYFSGREQFSNSYFDDADRARDLLRAAVERDPSFAEAWSWLARAEFFVVYAQTLLAKPERAMTEAELAPGFAAADRAIALDPSLAQPYAEKANALAYLGRWREAEAANALAVQHGGYSVFFLVNVGRQEEALMRARRAVELDPLDPRAVRYLRFSCYDTACMTAPARRALEIVPDDASAFADLFRILAAQGRTSEARTLYNANRRLMPAAERTEAPFGERYVRWRLNEGPPPSGAEILAAVARHEASSDLALYTLAELGDRERVAVMLQRWGPELRPVIFNLYTEGGAPFRPLPEFWALMEREGLLPYWRETGRWPDFCHRDPGNVCAPYRQE